METVRRIGVTFLTGLLVLVVVPLLIVLLPGLLLWHLTWGAVLRAWFYHVHRSHGRFILFVYSNSPNWQTHVEEHLLPKIAAHAVVLNWSERRTWPMTCPWEARMFQHWAGSNDFNPLALIFTGYWHVDTIRFYQAFRDFKHGRQQKLLQAEAKLFAARPSAQGEAGCMDR